MTEGYCVKCKCKQPMNNVMVKKYRAYIASGTCCSCGTKMSVAIKSEQAMLLMK